MSNAIRICVLNSLMESSYETSLPFFNQEIERLKDIELLALENLAFYRRYSSEEFNETAFKVLQSACIERIALEVGKGILWARSFDREQIKAFDKNPTDIQKTQAK